MTFTYGTHNRRYILNAQLSESKQLLEKIEEAAKRGDRFAIDILYTRLSAKHSDKEIVKLYKEWKNESTAIKSSPTKD